MAGRARRAPPARAHKLRPCAALPRSGHHTESVRIALPRITQSEGIVHATSHQIGANEQRQVASTDAVQYTERVLCVCSGEAAPLQVGAWCEPQPVSHTAAAASRLGKGRERGARCPRSEARAGSTKLCRRQRKRLLWGWVRASLVGSGAAPNSGRPSVHCVKPRRKPPHAWPNAAYSGVAWLAAARRPVAPPAMTNHLADSIAVTRSTVNSIAALAGAARMMQGVKPL